MTTTDFAVPTREEYERMAYEYMASLPLEHYMETDDAATQRKITMESLDLLTARRPEVRVFNELLVQYPRPNRRNGQIVPDNMIVIQDQPIGSIASFNLVHEHSPLFMVQEYVSSGRESQRKDYETNRLKYERELAVPYYMLFDPAAQRLTLLHLDASMYEDVKPNAKGRLPIPELDLELAIHDGWVRYWYEGELLPLPAELLATLDSERQRAEREKDRAEREKDRAEREKQRANAEAERAKRLEEKLRSLGIDPNA